MQRVNRNNEIQRYLVTAEQMAAIEGQVFEAGMPVAALMEKVALAIAQRVQQWYPRSSFARVGILVGPGHNGGDALVVARELHHAGYMVKLYRPIAKAKDLTAAHAQYAASLGIPTEETIESFKACDWILDGLFGFGLTRPITGAIATDIEVLNQGSQPIVSIDLPSGLHTDTGEVLGTAIQADRTLCLGLWKRAFVQDHALPYLGQTELIDFDLPLADIQVVLGTDPDCQRITSQRAIAPLRQPISPIAHKYRQGHLLLICGSQQYMGAALLSGLGARASGAGMVTIAVPESLKSLVVAQLPEALAIACLEQADGSIYALPDSIDLSRYDAIACGPGLTMKATPVVQQALTCDCPLLLDADGLNGLAKLGTLETLRQRTAPTILTPHPGEFRRLFPDLADEGDRLVAVQTAASSSGSVIVHKGARVAIACPSSDPAESSSVHLYVNPHSTPALARGGSGDVLTGLLGGLFAQSAHTSLSITKSAIAAVWWHAQAGIDAAHHRTERGVDAFTLSQSLMPTLQTRLTDPLNAD